MKGFVLFLVLCSLVVFDAAFGSANVMAQGPKAIPTPESILGFKVGDDFKLATYEDALKYFRALEQSSQYVRLVEIGRTSEGRPWYMALISTLDNLSNIERYRQISLRLAHPAGLSEEEAIRLSREGRPFVHIDGGLHSTEVAGGQHTIQLAYDLVSKAEDPKIHEMLSNVILMLWPSLNPDGQTMVAEWYRSNVGTPYEASPLPRLYQDYVGHDNNRDAYMLNTVESRVVERAWRDWEPQITYVQHQAPPLPTRIWLPPFAEPIASQAPPLMSRTVNMIGMAIAQALEEHGHPGADHMGKGFDAWYPGYGDYMPMLQNRAAFWTETALYAYATPHFYTVRDFPRDKAGLRAESLYSSPWKGGWWRLRDAVEYMETASMAVIDYASKYRENVLFNRYRAGRETIRKYTQEPPFAYIIPQDQRDPVAPVELLRRLAFNGVRVDQLAKPLTIEGFAYPAGTWVIPMDQEYAELVRQVMQVQNYPNLRDSPDGPLDQPYDVAGWTLPYQMDVRAVEVTTPLSTEERAALKPVAGQTVDWKSQTNNLIPDAAPFDSAPGIGFNTDAVAAGITPLPGKRVGSGPSLMLSAAANNTYKAINLAWQAGGKVQYIPATPAADGKPATAAHFLITDVPEATLTKWTESLALRGEATAAKGEPLAQPRIAVYHPWAPSIDEGWTRWVLDQYDFKYTELTNAGVRAGALRDQFDVIVIANINSRTIVGGFAEGTVPGRYAGGLGDAGTRELEAFVREGGTLVCLNNSSVFAIDAMHLPVKNVVAGLPNKEFFMAGSVLGVEVDTTHPVMAGMPTNAKVFGEYGPVFTTTDGFEGTALAKYQTEGTPLLSGYLAGEKYLQGYAAALDVKHGNGHVILLGFSPQWRGQPFGTFRVLFNSLFYYGEHASATKTTPAFWSAPKPKVAPR